MLPRPALGPVPLDELKSIPQKPRLLTRTGNWPALLRSAAEYVAAAPQWGARIKSFVDPYPAPFRRVRLQSQDGTPLSAWLGLHTAKGKPRRRPGLLIVPGLFASKDLQLQRARAVKVWRDWGFHVLVVELRGFGASKRVRATAGWKESEDVQAAIEFFRRRAPLGRLHVYAESLGGSAALIAAAHAARAGRPFIDGRMVTVSPFADAARIARHLSRKKSPGLEFVMVQWFLVQLLHLGGHPEPDFWSYVKSAAQSYGTDRRTLLRRSSPKHHVARVRTPTLILLSDDDPLVPRADLGEFRRRLRGRRNPALWRLPWGSHCLYELADPEWFWRVLARTYEAPIQGQSTPGGSRPAS